MTNAYTQTKRQCTDCQRQHDPYGEDWPTDKCVCGSPTYEAHQYGREPRVWRYDVVADYLAAKSTEESQLGQ